MSDHRTPLNSGTKIQLEHGNIYEITGSPIGFGGGSIIYPTERIYYRNGEIERDGIIYALKECYPSSADHHFIRNEYGEVIPAMNYHA